MDVGNHVVSPRSSYNSQARASGAQSHNFTGVGNNQLSSTDDSAVLFEGVRDRKTDIEGNSMIESETSHHTSGSSSISSSILRNGQQAIFSFISSMKDRKQRRGWKYLLFSVVYNLYIVWTSIWVSTLGSFNFGEYGEWLFTVLNYPITLSLNIVPHDSMIIITSIVIAICFLTTLLVCASIWGVYKASRHMEKLRNLLVIVGLFMNGLSMIFVFILTSFIECDYTKMVYFEEIDDKDFVLARFPTVRCFGESNSVLYGFSIASFFMLCISILATRFNFSPTWDSSLVFKPVYDWPLTFFSIINVSQVFFIYFIPVNSFGRAVFHLLLSLLWVPTMFVVMPYQKIWENSIYTGTGCAKVGAAIGSLISSLTNTLGLWDLGLGMMGLTLGLTFIGFIGGIIAMEAYIRLIKKRMSNLIIDQGQYEDLGSSKTSSSSSLSNEVVKSLIEKKASSILLHISEKGLTKELNIFLRFSFSVDIIRKRATNYEEKGKNSLTDTEIAIALVKGSHNSRLLSSPTSLYFAILLIFYCLTEERAVNYALSLITKLNRDSISLTDRIACQDLMKEINKSEKRISMKNTC